MMPDVCERLVLVPGRFSSYQSIGHTSLHTSQCNAQMKISFPGLIFAQYKSINIIIIIIIIIIIMPGRGIFQVDMKKISGIK